MASPVSRARTSTASSAGLGGGSGADRRRPAGQLAGAEPSGFGVAGPDHLGHLGVAGGPEPQLVLEQGPPARGVAARTGRTGHVLPHRGRAGHGGLADRHLGQQHGAGPSPSTSRGGPGAGPACCRSGRRPHPRSGRRPRPRRRPTRRRCPARRRDRPPRPAAGPGSPPCALLGSAARSPVAALVVDGLRHGWTTPVEAPGGPAPVERYLYWNRYASAPGAGAIGRASGPVPIGAGRVRSPPIGPRFDRSVAPVRT